MAKAKKSFVRNAAIGKILSQALHISVQRSIIQSLRLRIRTGMQFHGLAPVILDLKAPVKALLSQLKWLLKRLLKQQWSMA